MAGHRPDTSSLTSVAVLCVHEPRVANKFEAPIQDLTQALRRSGHEDWYSTAWVVLSSCGRSGSYGKGRALALANTSTTQEAVVEPDRVAGDANQQPQRKCTPR